MQNDKKSVIYLDVVTITVFALAFVVSGVGVSYFIGKVVFGWSFIFLSITWFVWRVWGWFVSAGVSWNWSVGW